MIIKLFTVLLLALTLCACKSEKVKPVINTQIRVEELPAQESWNSEVVFSDSGLIKAILHTGHLRVFVDAQETLLDSGLKVDFYNDNEIKTTTLTSVRGRVDDITQNLFAIENVVAVNDSGVTIETDELMWRNKDRRIVSDKFVKITGPKEIIEGYGFESDQSLRDYVIRNITYISRPDTSGGNNK
jgi:LPS export ABC transporter protein LptC